MERRAGLVTAVVPRFQRGGVTFEVYAAVVGGQLVQPSGETTPATAPQWVKPAGATSTTVLGVAVTDALPTSDTQNPSIEGETASVNLSPLPPYVSVEFLGVWPLQYAANCTFGTKVKAAATGKVTPMSADDDPELIVGICYQPGGVTYTADATNAGDTLLTL
jgi:hypothetical protein